MFSLPVRIVGQDGDLHFAPVEYQPFNRFKSTTGPPRRRRRLRYWLKKQFSIGTKVKLSQSGRAETSRDSPVLSAKLKTVRDNCGLKLRSLCETFTLAPKTLRRSGRALQSSPEKRVRLLQGRSAARPQPALLSLFSQGSPAG